LEGLKFHKQHITLQLFDPDGVAETSWICKLRMCDDFGFWQI